MLDFNLIAKMPDEVRARFEMEAIDVLLVEAPKLCAELKECPIGIFDTAAMECLALLRSGLSEATILQRLRARSAQLFRSE